MKYACKRTIFTFMEINFLPLIWKQKHTFCSSDFEYFVLLYSPISGKSSLKKFLRKTNFVRGVPSTPFGTNGWEIPLSVKR